MKTVVKGGTIVNEGRCWAGSLMIDGDVLVNVAEGDIDEQAADRVVDATGCFVLPGIIDEHVHFREPGLTDKADIDTESRAAAAGGVTTYFDMPNTMPQTTTLETLDEKFRLAAAKSHVNYAFFFGATNDNTALFHLLDPHRVPGIKLFMGSSTGNMLVDRDEALERIFSQTPLPLMAHCEDTELINRNMADFKKRFGDDPPVDCHPFIRSQDACLQSTKKAIRLAVEHQTRLHIAHISTAAELELIPEGPMNIITAEATVGHLLFEQSDYARLGTGIKVNPAIKCTSDRDALRKGLVDGRISTIATDHAPHLLAQKQGASAKAASGMPMIQYALVSMLDFVSKGVISMPRLVELMAHNPATIFSVRQRGYLRPGYKADVVIVKKGTPWVVTANGIESKCKWSPVEGRWYDWHVEKTFCNGHLVYDNGQVDSSYIGQPVMFR